MSLSFGKEFHAASAVSEEMQRKLLYLAMTDNGAVLTRHSILRPFDISASQKLDGQLVDMIITLMQAEQQRVRIAALEDVLNKREAASYEALIETQDRLRKAEERLQYIQSRASKVIFPDGIIRRVYRDGDQVRTEDGTRVSTDVVQPEDIPDTVSTWSEFYAAHETVKGLQHIETQIFQDRTRLDEIREHLEGNPSSESLDRLEKELSSMPETHEGYGLIDGTLDDDPLKPTHQSATPGLGFSPS